MGLATYAAAESYMGQPGTARVPYPPGNVPPPAAANLPPAAATVQRSSPANPNEPSPWREGQSFRRKHKDDPPPPWKESSKRAADEMETEIQRVTRRLVETEPDIMPSSYAEELKAKSRRKRQETEAAKTTPRSESKKCLENARRSSQEHHGAPRNAKEDEKIFKQITTDLKSIESNRSKGPDEKTTPSSEERAGKSAQTIGNDMETSSSAPPPSEPIREKGPSEHGSSPQDDHYKDRTSPTPKRGRGEGDNVEEEDNVRRDKTRRSERTGEERKSKKHRRDDRSPIHETHRRAERQWRKDNKDDEEGNKGSRKNKKKRHEKGQQEGRKEKPKRPVVLKEGPGNHRGRSRKRSCPELKPRKGPATKKRTGESGENRSPQPWLRMEVNNSDDERLCSRSPSVDSKADLAPPRSRSSSPDWGADEPPLAQPVGAEDDAHESSPEPDQKPDLRQKMEPMEADNLPLMDRHTRKILKRLEGEVAGLQEQMGRLQVNLVAAKQEQYLASGGRVNFRRSRA